MKLPHPQILIPAVNMISAADRCSGAKQGGGKGAGTNSREITNTFLPNVFHAVMCSRNSADSKMSEILTGRGGWGGVNEMNSVNTHFSISKHRKIQAPQAP